MSHVVSLWRFPNASMNRGARVTHVLSRRREGKRRTVAVPGHRMEGQAHLQPTGGHPFFISSALCTCLQVSLFEGSHGFGLRAAWVLLRSGGGQACVY